MPTAYSYVRFSTPAQREGDSLRRQIVAAEKHCEEHGLTLDTSLRDLGLSAYKSEHRAKGALGSFLIRVQHGEIQRGSYLLIENLDRLSREQVMVAFDLFRSIISAGITVVTLSDKRAYSEASINENWTDLIITLGAMARAHEESATKARRIREAKAEARRKARDEGRTLTKSMPPWITLAEDQRVVVEARAEIVRQIFQLADQGMGRTLIVRWLHQNKIAPWGKGKRASDGWHETFITRLLKGRAVLGEFQPHTFIDGKRVPDGEPILGYFPTIVDAALFARVNAHAAARKAMMGGRRSEKLANLVSGLTKCRECGGTMRYREKRPEGAVVVIAGKSYVKPHADASLICSRAERHSGGCSNRAGIAYHSFEKALLDSTLHLALDDQSFSNRGEVGRLTSLIAERQRGLDVAQAKAERLWTAWAEGSSDTVKKLAEAADAEAGETRANLKALASQLEQARGRAGNAEHLKRVADIRAKLHDPDLAVRVPLRRKVLEAFHTLIDRIECGATGATVFLIAGAGLITIDRKGRTGGYDLVKEGREDQLPELVDYARRRREALREGELFRRTA